MPDNLLQRIVMEHMSICLGMNEGIKALSVAKRCLNSIGEDGFSSMR